MTEQEEQTALTSAWCKIQAYVKSKCQFPRTMTFAIPQKVYTSYAALEVYPNGDCAVTWHSDVCRPSFPIIICGDEEFVLHNWKWHGEEEDLVRMREADSKDVEWFRTYRSYWLLRDLVDNWANVKRIMLDAVETQKRLEKFEP